MPRTSTHHGLQPQLPPGLMRLEERIVYDAAGTGDPRESVDPVLSDADATDAADVQDRSPDAPAETQTVSSESTGPRLLLIANTLAQAEKLTAAAREDVVTVRYDPTHTSPESLLGLLQQALGEKQAQSIALATHGTAGQGFQVAGSTTVQLETLHEPAMAAFWEGLASLVAPDGRMDVLACDVAAGDAGQQLVESLEHLTGMDLAASDDATGNTPAGGNWVLETDGVDAGALYFDADRLAEVDGHLANEAPTNIILTDLTPVEMQSTVFTLTDAGSIADGQFGSAVHAEGDRIIVGEPGTAAGGQASVYEWNGTQWTAVGSAFNSDNGANARDYGTAVALDASWAMVSDPQDVGAPRVEFLQWNGSAWAFKAQAAGGASFGTAIALDGDKSALGIPDADQVQMYHYDDLIPNDWGPKGGPIAGPGGAGEAFGCTVSLVGDRMLVGAKDSTAGAGRVYAYAFGGAWTNTQTLAASDSAAGAHLGSSVSFDGTHVVVGAPGLGAGAAYVFAWQGGQWVQQQKLSPDDGAGGDQFGDSVSIRGDTIVVGARGADIGGQADAGAAYVFRFNGTSWTQVDKVVAENSAAGDGFGMAVAASPGVAIVGAPNADTAQGMNAGAVSSYRAEPEVPEGSPGGTLVATISGTDPNGDTMSFSLVGGATDTFAVAGDQLQVKPGASLDFEITPVYTVRIRATDIHGASREEVFTIHVGDESESPSLPPPPPVEPPGGGGDEPGGGEEPEIPDEPVFEEPSDQGESVDESGSHDEFGELSGLDFSFTKAVQEEEREKPGKQPADRQTLQDANLDLAFHLADLAFDEDVLFDEAQPQEIREAFGTILRAYATSNDELAAYLQSAFRSVAESAVIYRSAGLAHALAAKQLDRGHSDPALAKGMPVLLKELDRSRAAVREATQELRSAIVHAASAGERGFDRALQDVITAALLSLDEANTQLLVSSKTAENVAAGLREALDQTTKPTPPLPAFAPLLDKAKTAAQSFVEARRKGWDLVSEDVFAAFLKRLVAGKREPAREGTK